MQMSVPLPFILYIVFGTGLALACRVKFQIFRVQKFKRVLFVFPLAAILGAGAALVLPILNGANPFSTVSLGLWIYMLGFAPIGEEYFYRFAMYGMLKKIDTRGFFTIGATSALFGLSHLTTLAFDPRNWSFYLLQCAFAAAMGVILGWTREVTGGIVASWLAHLLVNAAFLAAAVWF